MIEEEEIEDLTMIEILTTLEMEVEMEEETEEEEMEEEMVMLHDLMVTDLEIEVDSIMIETIDLLEVEEEEEVID